MKNTNKRANGELVKTLLCLVAVLAISIPAYSRGGKMSKEKQIGQVFTPDYLVQDILDVTGYNSSNSILKKHIIDNSCGNGAFLTEVVRRYCEAHIKEMKNKRGLVNALCKYVHGVELDEVAYVECVENLNKVAKEYGIEGVAWDVKNADTLTITDFDGRMDYVVGNPPYVRVHNLENNFTKVKQFKFCTGGMTDLYLVFYEIGLRMLSENGKLCYIAPSSWINSVAGHNMRTFVRDNKCLRKIIDLGHYQPFKATAYTAIVLLSKSSGDANFLYCTYEGPHKIDEVEWINYQDAFFDSCLYLGSSKALKSFREVKTKCVPKYVSVKNGFATLADDVFISSNFPFEEFIIPVIKASTGKWRKCFYPYDHNGKQLSTEEIFSNKKVAEYLRLHKDELLKGKSEQSHPLWYLFGRTQALKDVWVPKMAVNTCVRDVASLKINSVPTGSGVYSGLYVLHTIPEEYIVKALMTDDFIEYIKMLKKYKSGGYYTFNSKELEQYLNCKLDLLLPEKFRKKIGKQEMLDL